MENELADKLLEFAQVLERSGDVGLVYDPVQCPEQVFFTLHEAKRGRKIFDFMSVDHLIYLCLLLREELL